MDFCAITSFGPEILFLILMGWVVRNNHNIDGAQNLPVSYPVIRLFIVVMNWIGKDDRART